MGLLLFQASSCWGLILSVLSVAVVAYRNDLSSRHGCIWSTIEPNVKEGLTSTPSSSTGMLNPLPHQQAINPSGSSAGYSLNCNLRTLNADFWNYTFNREQIEKTRVVKIKCSDKLIFESLLSPNQTLFQLPNLKEVVIDSCKIRKLPGKFAKSLNKLKNLVIRTQNTEWKSSSAGLEIETDAFQGLHELEMLDLSENNWIFTESKTVLCPLRNLKVLNVSYNKLSDVEELISSASGKGDNYCALSVQSVDLSHNALRRVGQDAFSQMRRITELRLQNNLISELEDTAFQQLTQLKLLNLSSNPRLVALPPFIFKANVNLRELYLQNNSISALSTEVFAKMQQLLLLDLSRNSLTSQWVKEDMFSGLIRLVVLKLSYNQLSYIDSIIFKDLISLQALHLDNNKIDTISPEAFQSLSNLHILDLSNNRISYVDGKMLSNLFVLRQLYLDHNKIRTMEDDSLKNCTSIQDLGLADNLLQEVPVALQSTSLGLLKTLDIGENKIVHVSNNSFAGLTQLYGLRMVENRILELPAGFCTSLKMLRVLNLSQNKINKISSGAFTLCQELRVLRLDANSLEELPPTLAPQLPSLLWLNVSENRLKWADLKTLPLSLEWLDLTYNAIESLTGPTPRLPGNNSNSKTNTIMPSHLRVLDLSYNKITVIDQNSIPSSLETLRVNHNPLTTIAPNTFALSSRLRRVELIGGQIENLPLSSIRIPQIPPGKFLPEFFLGDNKFQCNCDMEWLTRVNQLTILRTHPRIVDLDKIACRTTFQRSTSIGHEIIPLVEATTRDFLCPYSTSHCFSLCHCCEFEGCDCRMDCPDNCTCYHNSAWSANIVECSNLQYENVPVRVPMDATELYLDGNRIFQLESHIFIGKKNLRLLYLNNSHVEVIKNRTFNGLRSLEILHLEENSLTELNGFEFSDVQNLRELYLNNNMLRYIAQDSFAHLTFLQVLRLDGNRLVDFSVWELTGNGYLNSVMLSNNPWSCECDFLHPFRTWVASKSAIVVDFTLAKCQMHDYLAIESESLEQSQHTISSMCNYEQTVGNEIETNHIMPMGGAENVGGPQPTENHLNFSRLETNADNTFWALILCLTAFLIVILVILAIFRQEIYYWARNVLLQEDGGSFCSNLLCCCCPGKYSGAHHPGKISCPSSRSDDQEKLFDAYFLYSRKDEDILLQKIVPELEDPTTATPTPGNKFRLCLHYRDLCLSPDSPFNREMILSACDASKRVVIVLSKTFLNSEWSTSSHFRTSIQSAIGLHQKKIIFILLPDFDQGLSSISSELGNYSSSLKNSSVHWSDKNFWGKFKKLLPTPSTIPPTLNETAILNLHSLPPNNCDPSQLPYNLVMNPNLHQLQQMQQQLRANANTHHYHHNIIPYQIPVPMSRNNGSTLPPIPKHQIVLPANTTNNTMNQNHSLIHPIPSQLTPQHFGYSNETFHLQHQGNHHQNFQNLHHPNNNHNNQPIHFSAQQHHHHQLSVIPPHSHSHTPSQISNNFSSVVGYPHNHHPHYHHHNQSEQEYSSSAVSSANGNEFDHVYSTLDSPLQSPAAFTSDVVDYSPGGGGESNARNNSKHTAQHSTSSGVSSGSDMTCGESSSAVSPSSPIKNGILNKLNAQQMNTSSGSNNGKMYFV